MYNHIFIHLLFQRNSTPIKEGYHFAKCTFAGLPYIQNDFVHHDDEKDIKITDCKRSAALTVVEQSVDAEPNFKLVKNVVKTMNFPHENINPIVNILTKAKSELEDTSNGDRDVVILKSHKKKAILFAILNLPKATSIVYTRANVHKGLQLSIHP